MGSKYNNINKSEAIYISEKQMAVLPGSFIVPTREEETQARGRNRGWQVSSPLNKLNH